MARTSRLLLAAIVLSIGCIYWVLSSSSGANLLEPADSSHTRKDGEPAAEIEWFASEGAVQFVVDALPYDAQRLKRTLLSLASLDTEGISISIDVMTDNVAAAKQLATTVGLPLVHVIKEAEGWASFFRTSATYGDSTSVCMLVQGVQVHPLGFYTWAKHASGILAGGQFLGAGLEPLPHSNFHMTVTGQAGLAVRAGYLTRAAEWRKLAEMMVGGLEDALTQMQKQTNKMSLYPPVQAACALVAQDEPLPLHDTQQCTLWKTRVQRSDLSTIKLIDVHNRSWALKHAFECHDALVPAITPAGGQCCPPHGQGNVCQQLPLGEYRIVVHHNCHTPAGLLVHTLKHIDPRVMRSYLADLEVVMYHTSEDDEICDEAYGVTERWAWRSGYMRLTTVKDARMTPNMSPSLLGAAIISDLWPAPFAQEQGSDKLKIVFVSSGLELSPIALRWSSESLAHYSRKAPVGGVVLLPQSGPRFRIEGVKLTPTISAVYGSDGFVLPNSLHQDVLEWARKYAKRSILDDFGWGVQRGQPLSGAFRFLLSFFLQQQGRFTIQPGGLLLARSYEDIGNHVPMASLDTNFVHTAKPSALDRNGDPVALCMAGACPRVATCEDTLDGAVCMCPVDQPTCTENWSSGSSSRPTMLTESSQVRAMIDDIAVNNDVTLLTVSSGFIDFAVNLITSMQRTGVTNYFIIAEDYACYEAMNARYRGRVVLPSLRIMMTGMMSGSKDSSSGFSYASKQYNELVSRRPRYLIAILKLGFNVLYTDTDTVWLSNPYKHLEPGYDLQISSDKEDETFDPWHMLCTGFMYYTQSQIALDFLNDWRRELEAQKGRFVNQYIFNDLFNSKYKRTLKVRPLPDEYFPSGALFFWPRWRQQQAHQPAVVHNNFIVGPDNKRQRFINLGLWYVGKDRA